MRVDYLAGLIAELSERGLITPQDLKGEGTFWFGAPALRAGAVEAYASGEDDNRVVARGTLAAGQAQQGGNLLRTKTIDLDEVSETRIADSAGSSSRCSNAGEHLCTDTLAPRAPSMRDQRRRPCAPEAAKAQDARIAFNITKMTQERAFEEDRVIKGLWIAHSLLT